MGKPQPAAFLRITNTRNNIIIELLVRTFSWLQVCMLWPSLSRSHAQLHRHYLVLLSRTCVVNRLHHWFTGSPASELSRTSVLRHDLVLHREQTSPLAFAPLILYLSQEPRYPPAVRPGRPWLCYPDHTRDSTFIIELQASKSVLFKRHFNI